MLIPRNAEGQVADVEDRSPDLDEFRAAVLEGLSRPQKCLPTKFLYDSEGSRLFEEITRLDEYYLTRTEEELLQGARGELAELIGMKAQLIEFGAGSLQKVRILLGAMDRPAAFVPIDIAHDHLVDAARALGREFPQVAIRPLVADFAMPLNPALLAGLDGARRVAFFPGSTIGNFSPADAATFLTKVARMVGPGGDLLIGVDTKKDPDILFRAYNDSRGVTAAFNRNLLVRINRDLGADFVPARYRHWAPYNDAEGRVEMYLVAEGAQSVSVSGQVVTFADGERIHTENSYKYGIDEFLALARSSGLHPLRTWTDAQELFSVHYLRSI